MTLGYRLAYRLGIKPWERAGDAAVESFQRLLDREERDRSRPLGRALDLGCGTGSHTIELARRGWQPTGVDFVARALEQARSRPGADQASFVLGDVTDLAAAGITGEFDFFLDVGCFHGLKAPQRTAYGRSVTTLAAPRATMLMLCFSPGSPRPLPPGADRADLEAALPGWQITDQEPADVSGMPGPLKRTAPQWYRLARR